MECDGQVSLFNVFSSLVCWTLKALVGYKYVTHNCLHFLITCNPFSRSQLGIYIKNQTPLCSLKSRSWNSKWRGCRLVWFLNQIKFLGLVTEGERKGKKGWRSAPTSPQWSLQLSCGNSIGSVALKGPIGLNQFNRLPLCPSFGNVPKVDLIWSERNLNLLAKNSTVSAIIWW